jgi:hypothetical protein
MKYLLILLILLSSCGKKSQHSGIVIGHQWTPAYVIPSFVTSANGTVVPNNIYIDDEYSLKVLDHDTVYITRVDPYFYTNSKTGDSVSYMR